MNTLVTYCERLDPSWTAEPINTLSNLAFLLVAMKLWYQPNTHEDNNLHASESRTNDKLPATLAALLFLVGMGSASYHAFPGYITLALDVIPILSLAALLCWVLLTRLCALNHLWATVLVFVLVGSTMAMSNFNHFANGSLFYLPIWMCICALVLFTSKFNDEPGKRHKTGGVPFTAYEPRKGLRNRPSYRSTSLLLLTFSVALFARTVDVRFCEFSGVGTHFIWHILAAVSVYLAFKLLLLCEDSAEF